MIALAAGWSTGAVLAAVAFAGAALWQSHTRQRAARAAAAQWLHAQRYQVRTLTMPNSGTPFPFHVSRGHEYAFDVRSEINDRARGGIGVVWLRVWVDWRGRIRHDVEVCWEGKRNEAAS